MGRYDTVSGFESRLTCTRCEGPLDTPQSRDGWCDLDHVPYSAVDSLYSSCGMCGLFVEFEMWPKVENLTAPDGAYEALALITSDQGWAGRMAREYLERMPVAAPVARKPEHYRIERVSGFDGAPKCVNAVLGFWARTALEPAKLTDHIVGVEYLGEGVVVVRFECGLRGFVCRYAPNPGHVGGAKVERLDLYPYGLDGERFKVTGGMWTDLVLWLEGGDADALNMIPAAQVVPRDNPA